MTAASWPCATADEPPIPGVFKARHEDFRVDEVPAYRPTGEGDHVYFRVEKTGITTLRALRSIAAALGAKKRDIGVAGMKDARGVCRQTMSLEHADPDRIAALDLPRVRVLEVGRHRNKLRTGHLKGNRFAIRLRETEPDKVDVVNRVLSTLSATGAPNYYGPQRFGARGDTWEIGRALLRGEFELAARLICGDPRPGDVGSVREARELYEAGRLEHAADAWPPGYGDSARLCRELARREGQHRRCVMAGDRRLLGLYVSALQSYLFNQVVAERIGSLGAVAVGDLAWKHENGAVFLVEDAAVEQPRAKRFEISPTGPMFGQRMSAPGGSVARLEQAILEAEGLADLELPRSGPLRCRGGRRPLRVRPDGAVAEAGHDDHGPFIEVRFFLPAGSYATVVLREVCKDRLVVG
jgi:tRNA pseudouridine13 synthase